MNIPGINMHAIVEGKTLADHWQFYTVNVKKLQTMTHAQFEQEYPEATKMLIEASAMQNRLNELLRSTNGE